MGDTAEILQGGVFEDTRGRLYHCNTFDMTPVKRFYMIEHPDVSVIRAWQGHQKEQKWFYPISGSFIVGIVKPDDWKTPSADLPCEKFILSADDYSVLHIPGGMANGFRALTPGAKLMVYSDLLMEEAKNDDYRFSSDLWFDFNVVR